MSAPRRKRKRQKQRLPRLPEELASAVSQLATGTGWSPQQALAFMGRAGWNGLNAGCDKVAAMRQVMSAAVAHHETERAMRRRMAVTAGRLRAAHQALAGKVGGVQ